MKGEAHATMSKSQVSPETLSWLLEPDDPGVRYLALRDLVEDSKPAELRQAQKQAHESGPIANILQRMNKAGYWAAPGAGYYPKYRASVWSIILLAELGAAASDDARIQKACAYLLEHGLTDMGQFTAS